MVRAVSLEPIVKEFDSNFKDSFLGLKVLEKTLLVWTTNDQLLTFDRETFERVEASHTLPAAILKIEVFPWHLNSWLLVVIREGDSSPILDVIKLTAS